MSNKFDFSGAINLKNEQGFQEIYSSQNYGTFYSIYISFDSEKDETDEKIILLKNIKFKIVNYKGIINLGIVDVMWNPKITREEVGFKIMVEGMAKDKTFLFPTNKVFKIDTSRFSKFVIERELLEMSFFDKTKNPNDNLVFDNEFYYRDGLDFNITHEDNIRVRRGGMEGAGVSSSYKRCFTIELKMNY